MLLQAIFCLQFLFFLLWKLFIHENNNNYANDVCRVFFSERSKVRYNKKIVDFFIII